MKDISVMIDDVKFNFRVGAVIKNKGRVLFERGNEVDFLVIPGGRVQVLEIVENALIRELREELELDISKKELCLISIIENFFKINKIKYHELYYIYKIELDDEDIIVKQDKLINKDSKSSVFSWQQIDEIDNLKILPVELKSVIKSDGFKTIVVNDIK